MQTKSKRRAARPKREQRTAPLAFEGRWPSAERPLKTPCSCALGTCERCLRAAQRAGAR